MSADGVFYTPGTASCVFILLSETVSDGSECLENSLGQDGARALNASDEGGEPACGQRAIHHPVIG